MVMSLFTLLLTEAVANALGAGSAGGKVVNRASGVCRLRWYLYGSCYVVRTRQCCFGLSEIVHEGMCAGR